MRLLIATGIYPPDAGGPATYAQAFAQALVAARHQVSVVAYGDTPGTSTGDGFFVERIGRNQPLLVRYLKYALAVRRLAHTHDLVYLQGPGSEGVPGSFGAWLAGTPTAMKVVGDYAWEVAAGQGEKELLDTFLTHRHKGKIRIMEALERWSAKRANTIITPSHYLKSVVETWGVPSARITVIPNAISELPNGQSREKARQQFGLGHKRVLLTAVRAVPWKGGDFLISLLPDLPQDTVLLIAGDGPEQQAWKQLAIEKGVANRVQFLGRLTRERLADAYRAADLFVLASGYEGYPWVVAEAASVGLPSFVSDKGGNPETRTLLGANFVTVLPYQNRQAWLTALRAPWPSIDPTSSAALPSHSAMVEDTIHTLSTAEKGAALRVIFLSYERGLTNPSSGPFARVERLGTKEIRLSAVVLPATTEGVVAQGNLRSIGVTGPAPARLWKGFIATIQEVRRAKQHGERVLLSAQDPSLTGALAIVVSRLCNVPVEVQEHGDYFSGMWVREAPVIHRLWSWVGRAVLRRADGVRVVSDRVHGHLSTVGIEAGRMHVTPVAVDASALLTRPNRPWPDTPTIVAPCRFVKQKGIDTLLHALAVLAREGVTFRVRLIGEGPEGPRLATLAERLGIRDRISFEQWSDSKDIWEDADLFVLSSNYEGWGRTIAEAMAAGIPVVTTDVGCVGSFFRPDTHGLVVPPGDAAALATAIRTQFTQPDQRTAMAQRAREQVAAFPSADALADRQRTAWHTAATQTASRNAWKWTLGIVTFIALTRIISVWLFADPTGMNREWGFFTMVDNWFRGNGYSFVLEPGCVSAYRSPGYLFFLTAVYGIFGFPNFMAQAIIQNILAVVLAYLVYRLGWRLTGDRRVGWVAALLVAAHPYTFYHYTQYYHTVLSGLFLVGLLGSLLALHRTRRLSWAVWAGVMTAALAYIQGTILVAMPFLAAWLLWQWRKDIRKALLAVALIAIVSAGLIAPWTLRNGNAFHAFVPLTTDLGLALYKANTENYPRLLAAGYPHEALVEEPHPTDPSLLRYRYIPEIETMLEQTGGILPAAYWTEWHQHEPLRLETCTDPRFTPEPAQNAHWMALAKEWYLTHPADGLRLSARKALVFWQPGLYPSIKYGAAWSFGNHGFLATLARGSLIGYVALLELLALIGAFLTIRRKRLGSTAPLLIVLGAFTLMHMFFAPYTKYRIPLDNLTALFAAITVMAAWKRIKKGRGKRQ